MCHSFKVIALSVSEIIHGVYIPFSASTMMRRFNDSENYRIPHVHIRRGHINFCPENMASLFEFTIVHPSEQINIHVSHPFSEWAFDSWLRRSALLRGNNIGRLIIYICKSFLNKLYGEIIEIAKIIRCIIFPVIPVKAKPVNVLLN